MPMIMPHKNEDMKKFTDRCMSDEGIMKEYPDNKQRYAVCMSQLRKARGEKAAPKKGK